MSEPEHFDALISGSGGRVRTSPRNRNLLRTGVAGFAVALAIAPSLGLAQTEELGRAGNIWGGFNHEPVPTEVLPKERAAGVASPAREHEQDNEVERLYRNLIESESRRDHP